MKNINLIISSHRVSCEQCILQWTYTAGNNWGVCANGTGDLGCGPQETFRACSDIRIKSLSNKFKAGFTDTNSFDDETTFEVDQFEDYYDELFGSNMSNDIIINDIDADDDYHEAVTIQSVQTKKLQLLKKKLVLAKALKSLRHLIAMSKEKSEKKSSKLSSSEVKQLNGEYGEDSSTSMPWWSRTNGHGRKKRRRRRFSMIYDLLSS